MPNTSTLRNLAGALVAGVAALGFAAAAGAFSQASPATPVEPTVSALPTTGASPQPVPVPVPLAATSTQTPAVPSTLQAVPTLAPVPAVPVTPTTALPTSAQLAAAGITDPIKIERDDGRIEVEHRDSAGRRFETYFDARTGAVIRHELESSEDDRRGNYGDD